MDTHGVSRYTEYHPFSKITEHTLLKIYVLIIDPDSTLEVIRKKLQHNSKKKSPMYGFL